MPLFNKAPVTRKPKIDLGGAYIPSTFTHLPPVRTSQFTAKPKIVSESYNNNGKRIISTTKWSNGNVASSYRPFPLQSRRESPLRPRGIRNQNRPNQFQEMHNIFFSNPVTPKNIQKVKQVRNQVVNQVHSTYDNFGNTMFSPSPIKKYLPDWLQ